MGDQPAAGDIVQHVAAAQDDGVFSTHYRRLQSIEQSVVRAIEAASYVMQELSQPPETVNKYVLQHTAQAFMQQIQDAQRHVLEAIKSAAPERNLEANNYFLLVQAMVSAEKLDAVSVHISGISKILRQYKQQPGTEPDSSADADAIVEDVEAVADEFAMEQV